jgi:hypothetical protein
MKTICLFGDFRGFPNDAVAESTEELLKKAGDEEVVVISHGMPTGNANETVDPLLLTPDLHLHAFLLAQSGSPASLTDLEYLKDKLARACPRTFGMVRGWNSTQSEHRAKIINFLQSFETAPSDPDVQSLLGFDSPVARLALRVALEIALRELSGGTSTRHNLNLETLLSPAIRLAEQEPALAASLTGVSRALESDRKSLPHEISLALAELRS